MPTPRYGLAAAALNGIVYAVGGNNGGTIMTTMEAYDPVTNTWSTKAAMPTARHVLVAVAVNGIIYAIGGINGSGGGDTVEAYDPVANTWSTKAAMPAVRYEVAAAAVNGTVYAVGGTSASGIDALATNEAFTPPPNTPVGPNIPVQPVDSGTGTSPVTLNFFTVTEGGTTSLTISGTGQPPPSGFKLGNPPQYFDLTTTAVFSGPITICINYTGINFGNESNAKLFHQEGGLWVDRTISVDTVNNIICASATSLSPFAIFEPAYAAEVQQPIDPDGSSVFNVKRGVVPVKFTITYGGSATCQLPPATISLTRTAGAVLGAIDESTYLLASDSGSNFRIDTDNCQYVYNLATRSLGTGTYLVSISIGGSVVGSATFGLK